MKIPLIIVAVLVVAIGATAVFYDGFSGQSVLGLMERHETIEPDEPEIIPSTVIASSLGLQNGSLISFMGNDDAGFENYILVDANSSVIINVTVMDGERDDLEGLIPANRIQLELDGNMPIATYEQDGAPRGGMVLRDYVVNRLYYVLAFEVRVVDDRVVGLREVWESWGMNWQ